MAMDNVRRLGKNISKIRIGWTGHYNILATIKLNNLSFQMVSHGDA